MENFRIDFTLSNPFPDGKKIGECGEKNAAQLIITPPENLASREEIRSYVVAFSTDRGPVRYGPVPKAESVTVPVGNALTVGSALSVQLEGYDADGEFVIKSPVLSGIMIAGSIAEGNCNPDKIVIPGHMHDNLDVIGAPRYELFALERVEGDEVTVLEFILDHVEVDLGLVARLAKAGVGVCGVIVGYLLEILVGWGRIVLDGYRGARIIRLAVGLFCGLESGALFGERYTC